MWSRRRSMKKRKVMRFSTYLPQFIRKSSFCRFTIAGSLRTFVCMAVAALGKNATAIYTVTIFGEQLSCVHVSGLLDSVTPLKYTRLAERCGKEEVLRRPHTRLHPAIVSEVILKNLGVQGHPQTIVEILTRRLAINRDQIFILKTLESRTDQLDQTGELRLV